MKLLIYILGFVAAFVLTRWKMRREDPISSWSDIIGAAAFSSLSWIWFVFVASIVIYDNVKIKFPKPPKWL